MNVYIITTLRLAFYPDGRANVLDHMVLLTCRHFRDVAPTWRSAEWVPEYE
jgi:hypothetical protein